MAFSKKIDMKIESLWICFSLIQELENSASSDAIVREKIARLPPEVSEAGSLEKLQSAKDGQQLLEKVNLLWFVFLSNNNM